MNNTIYKKEIKNSLNIFKIIKKCQIFYLVSIYKKNKNHTKILITMLSIIDGVH